MGNSGAEYYYMGIHLHFGLKYCDKYGNALNWDNGYKGGIDPLPLIISDNNNMPLFLKIVGNIDTKRQYRLLNNKRYHIWNEDMLDDLKMERFINPDKVKWLSSKEIAKYPLAKMTWKEFWSQWTDK